MTSNYPAAYMTSGNGAPTMDIPEHVDGIIDLKTLEAIHQQLNESSDGDDQDLAIWIKEHYLYEPITQPGRQIRTSKGFAQLDRAFRRVRTLTGKAQDKWPFFDRNWKEMPSSMVRNNARGEASPGVRFPSMLRPMRGPSMTNGHNAHLGESSANTHERQFQFQGGPSPQSFVSFGSRAPIRHKNQRQQVFSLPIPNTSVPLPSNNKVPSKLCPDSDKTSAPQEVPAPEKQAQQDPRSTDDLPKYTDFFLRSEGPSSARSTSAPEERPEEVKVSSEGPADTPMPQNDEVAQMNADEVAREADNGKVRGPDGRYLTKPNSTPRKARRSTGGRRKSGRKSSTKTMLSSTPAPAEATSPAAAGDEEEDMEDQPSSSSAPEDATSPVAADPEDEDMIDQPSSPVEVPQNEPEAPDGSDDVNAPSTSDVAPASAPANATDLHKASVRSLSEPASSHLTSGMDSNDASPTKTTPAYLFLAAEAEAVSSNLDRLPPNSNRKNKRKGEAMVQQGPPKKRGRPRKVDVENTAEASTRVEVEKETGVRENTVMEDEAPRMATRRTTRRSTAANLELSAPASPEAKKSTPKKQQKPVEDEDKTMADVEDEDTTAGHEPSPPAPTISRSSLRASRSKVQSVPETPSQPDEPHANGVDLLALGLRKTDPPTKSKQLATQDAAQETDELPNGASKTGATQVVEHKQNLTQASAPAIANGTAPTKANESSTQDGLGKVEYIARVHTSAGMVDVPLPSNSLAEEAELVQKYAEWMATKGAAQVTFEVFKSIYALSRGH